MTNKELQEALEAKFSSQIIASEELHDALIIELAPNDVHGFILALKEDNALSFGFLTLIGAVHYPD